MDQEPKNLFNRYREELSLSADGKSRIKDAVMKRLSEPQPEPPQTLWDRLRGFAMSGYVLVPALLLIVTGLAAAASGSALPGEPLYPVKRQVESIQVMLAPTPEAKLNLQLNFAEERLKELEMVSKTIPPLPTPQPATTTPPEAEPPVPAKDPEPKKTKQRVDAEAEVRRTLDSLERAKKELEKQGKERRSEILEKTIETFKQKLEAEARVKGTREDRRKPNTKNQEAIRASEPATVDTPPKKNPKQEPSTQDENKKTNIFRRLMPQ